MQYAIMLFVMLRLVLDLSILEIQFNCSSPENIIIMMQISPFITFLKDH